MKNKEKIRRLSMAALSFILMLSIAGYINYKYDPEREKNLGQTVYVSNNDDVKIYEEDKNKEPESKISKYRNDRDNMYVELANSYSEIISNANSSQDTISQYQEKLSNLVEEKNKLLMLENMIRTKGIEDVVIVVTDSKKADVIIENDELTDEMIAQITDSVTQNLGINASDITIEKINN